MHNVCKQPHSKLVTDIPVKMKAKLLWGSRKLSKQASFICFYFFPQCVSFWEILLKGEVDRWPCITSPGNECCFIDLLVTNDSGLSASTTGNKWDVLYWNSTLHNFWTTKSVISYRMPLGCFFKNCCLQVEFTNNLLLSQYFRKSLKWEIDDKAEKEWW